MNRISKKPLILLCILLCGCTSANIDTYPEEVLQNSSNTVEDISVSGKVQREFTDANGNVLFHIDANVKGSTSDCLPVYEVKKRDLSSEELKEICDNIFEEGTVSCILPIDAADRNYLKERLSIIQNRIAEYENDEREVPLGFYDEKEAIEKLLDEYDSNAYKLKKPYSYEWIDMSEYYMENYGVDEECKFFAVEGIIGDSIWEFVASEVNGNEYIRIYEIRNRFESMEYFWYEGDENAPIYLGLDECVTQDEAKSLAYEFFGKMDVSGYDFNSANLISTEHYYIEDGEKESTLLNVKSKINLGYQVNYSKSYDGNTEFYDAYSDYFCGTYTNTCNCPSLNDLPNLFGPNAIQLYDNDTSVSVYGGCFETMSFAVDEKGVYAAMWSSPMETVEKKADKAVLLEFDKILDCAEIQAASLPKRTYNYVDKITKIELRMVRIKEADGNYTVAPAWFFVTKGWNDQVREDTKLCINAVDGSRIDLKNGGVRIF